MRKPTFTTIAGPNVSNMWTQIRAYRKLRTSEVNIDEVTKAIRDGWYLMGVEYEGGPHPTFILGSVNPNDNPLKNDPTWQGRRDTRQVAYACVQSDSQGVTITDLDQPDAAPQRIDLQSRCQQKGRAQTQAQPTHQRRGDPFPSVRLLPAEDKQVREAIRRSGKAQSEWIKSALLAYASDASVPTQ